MTSFQFLKQQLKRSKLIRFGVELARSGRSSLQQQREHKSLRQAMARANPLHIVIGASGTRQDGWIATEQSQLDLLLPNTWERFTPRSSIQAINAEHVWEHLSLQDGLIAAQTCFEFLCPGGRLRCAVPDGFHPSAEYIHYVQPGGTGVGSDDHKVLYTHESFADLFQTAGFETVLLEYFDRDGIFHSQDWDPADGMVSRSYRFDERNQSQAYGYTSLIIDAIKPKT